MERPVDALVIFTGTIGRVTSSSATTVLIAEVAASHASITLPSSDAESSVDEPLGGAGGVVLEAAAAAANAAAFGVLNAIPSPGRSAPFHLFRLCSRVACLLLQVEHVGLSLQSRAEWFGQKQ